ncbi:hypothetical protein Goari_009282, partial [Gossypium aridum]|nr:hypothetical protein [Gossypium aridum]
HYRDYPVDYRAAVTELLGKASALYFRRIQQLEGEQVGSAGAHDEISEPISNISKTALSPNLSFHGTPLMQSDHFLLPSSIEYYEGRDFGSVQDEQKESLIRLPQPSSIDVNGVLGQILFDVCVPKDVEGWDMKSSDSSSRHPYTSPWRNSHFNPIKCIRRSRL